MKSTGREPHKIDCELLDHSWGEHVFSDAKQHTRHFEKLNQVVDYRPDLRRAESLENITNTETIIHSRLIGRCSLNVTKPIEC